MVVRCRANDGPLRDRSLLVPVDEEGVPRRVDQSSDVAFAAHCLRQIRTLDLGSDCAASTALEFGLGRTCP
jgi:hypothetical protein